MSKTATYECPSCGHVTVRLEAPAVCKLEKCNGIPRQVSPEEPKPKKPKKSKRGK